MKMIDVFEHNPREQAERQLRWERFRRVKLVCGVVVAAVLVAASLAGCAADEAAQVDTAANDEAAAAAASANAGQDPQTNAVNGVVTATVSIDGTPYEVNVPDGSSVLDALEATGVTMDQTASATGAFVTAINGRANSSTQAWVYTVNGASAQVSAEYFSVSQGDTIAWDYVTF
jgi:hypothetical protein